MGKFFDSSSGRVSKKLKAFSDSVRFVRGITSEPVSSNLCVDVRGVALETVLSDSAVFVRVIESETVLLDLGLFAPGIASKMVLPDAMVGCDDREGRGILGLWCVFV
jgi:hypothetical protein